jgi:hypothetical protein
VKVGDFQPLSVGQHEEAVAARPFEVGQLIEERGRSSFVVRAALRVPFVFRVTLRCRSWFGRLCCRSSFDGRRRRRLAPDLRGFLVVAEAEIHRLPQLAVRGPLGEAHLRDQLRPDPMRPLVGLRHLGERALARFETFQHRHHPGQLALVEAGAGVPHVDQPSGIVVHAHEQRAEIRPRLPRLGPAADDELLFVEEFDLAPVGRALARLVERHRVLRDQPFPFLIDRLPVQRASIAPHDGAEPHDRRRLGLREHPFQCGAALDERAVAQIARVLAEQIEGDVGHGGAGRARRSGRASTAGGAARLRRVEHVNAALQILKTGRVAGRIERDDFAVDDQRNLQRAAPRVERRRDFRELTGLLVAEPRPQTRRGAAGGLTRRSDLCDRADAVVFGFVHELRVVERRL